MSAPGADEIKRLMLNCTDCHTLQRVFESRHDEAAFLKVFERMSGYYPGASDMQPQRLVGEHRRPAVSAGMQQKFAEYLASINLNGRSTHPFDIKMLERPKGRATKVVVTEYDLPRREIQPHDVVVDPDGMVWFSHFGEQFLSRMDPKTGKTTDYPIPVQKAGSSERYSRPRGRSGRRYLGRPHVPDRSCEVRSQDRGLPRSLPAAQGVAARRHAAIALLGCRVEGRRQSLGKELRPLADHAARYRDRRI